MEFKLRQETFPPLTPGDFETISVLKDASATSAYGSRGANGVIVITSKKGRPGSVRLNYDVQYGYSTLPENKLKLMNTNEKLDYELAHDNPYGWTASELDSLRKIETAGKMCFSEQAALPNMC